MVQPDDALKVAVVLCPGRDSLLFVDNQVITRLMTSDMIGGRVVVNT